VEAAIQKRPWHHLAEAAVGEPFRQAVAEEAGQLSHPAEGAVEERHHLVEVEVEEFCLLEAEVGEEPLLPAVVEEQHCPLKEAGEAALSL
jgi:hypothetical protein